MMRKLLLAILFVGGVAQAAYLGVGGGRGIAVGVKPGQRIMAEAALLVYYRNPPPGHGGWTIKEWLAGLFLFDIVNWADFHFHLGPKLVGQFSHSRWGSDFDRFGAYLTIQPEFSLSKKLSIFVADEIAGFTIHRYLEDTSHFAATPWTFSIGVRFTFD